jgi:hypothetical protein
MRDRHHLAFSSEDIESYLRHRGFEETERKGKHFWFKPEGKGADGNAPPSMDKKIYGDNLN